MGDETPQPDTPAQQVESDLHAERRCVACGYNLFGLGEEPRCPECGLRNIPSGFRQQVWDLVDSGKWFFSGFFTPFAKRPPGWWWALDRPGDVKRSFKVAGRNVLIAAILILVAGVIADSILLETVTTYTYLDSTDPTALPKDAGTYGGVFGLAATYKDRWWDIDGAYFAPTAYGGTQSTRTRTFVEFSYKSIIPGLIATGWVFWVWATPALVGLWTQIRKGLPKFAHAPQTIIAAANYESHRLPYVALLIVFWMLLDTSLRAIISPSGYVFLSGPISVAGFLLLTGSAALGWVGPLRSDYTKQLIRSRWHAARVLIMYALVFPWVMTILSMAIVSIVAELILGCCNSPIVNLQSPILPLRRCLIAVPRFSTDHPLRYLHGRRPQRARVQEEKEPDVRKKKYPNRPKKPHWRYRKRGFAKKADPNRPTASQAGRARPEHQSVLARAISLGGWHGQARQRPATAGLATLDRALHSDRGTVTSRGRLETRLEAEVGQVDAAAGKETCRRSEAGATAGLATLDRALHSDRGTVTSLGRLAAVQAEAQAWSQGR